MTKLVLVCGNAGSGKTYIGKLLTKKFSKSVYMDKDTLTRPFVEEILVNLNSSQHDRESDIYLEKVRPLEYEILLKHAKENLELGINVIASAPFIKEITDETWLSNLREEMEFDNVTVIVVWIEADEQTMKRRIINRNAKRDVWKIKNWNEYVNNIYIKSPISDAIIIDNSEDFSISLMNQIDDNFR